MNRFTLAAVLALVLGSQADAQYYYTPSYYYPGEVVPAAYAVPAYVPPRVVRAGYYTPAYVAPAYPAAYVAPAYAPVYAPGVYVYGRPGVFGWRRW